MAGPPKAVNPRRKKGRKMPSGCEELGFGVGWLADTRVGRRSPALPLRRTRICD
jgi:hypothetical protein